MVLGLKRNSGPKRCSIRQPRHLGQPSGAQSVQRGRWWQDSQKRENSEVSIPFSRGHSRSSHRRWGYGSVRDQNVAEVSSACEVCGTGASFLVCNSANAKNSWTGPRNVWLSTTSSVQCKRQSCPRERHDWRSFALTCWISQYHLCWRTMRRLKLPC